MLQVYIFLTKTNNYPNHRRNEFQTLLENYKHRNRWSPASINELKAFLEADSSCIDEPQGRFNYSALRSIFDGTKNCPLELVRLLLNPGANVNGLNCDFLTPLHTAVVNEHSFDVIQLLLYAGARVRAGPRTHTIESCENHPVLLVIALDSFLEVEDGFYVNLERYTSQNKLAILKLLLKHCLLEDPNYDIRKLSNVRNMYGENYPQLKELVRFAIECSRQVQVMRSKNISSNSSLLYFIKRRLSPRTSASGNSPPLSNQEFRRLVSILKDGDLSQYLEVVAKLVGKPTMLANSQELQVYTVRNGSAFNETIYLNHFCLLEVIRFLCPEDSLKLFIACSR